MPSFASFLAKLCSCFSKQSVRDDKPDEPIRQIKVYGGAPPTTPSSSTTNKPAPPSPTSRRRDSGCSSSSFVAECPAGTSHTRKETDSLTGNTNNIPIGINQQGPRRHQTSSEYSTVRGAPFPATPPPSRPFTPVRLEGVGSLLHQGRTGPYAGKQVRVSTRKPVEWKYSEESYRETAANVHRHGKLPWEEEEDRRQVDEITMLEVQRSLRFGMQDSLDVYDCPRRRRGGRR